MDNNLISLLISPAKTKEKLTSIVAPPKVKVQSPTDSLRFVNVSNTGEIKRITYGEYIKTENVKKENKAARKIVRTKIVEKGKTPLAILRSEIERALAMAATRSRNTISIRDYKRMFGAYLDGCTQTEFRNINKEISHYDSLFDRSTLDAEVCKHYGRHLGLYFDINVLKNLYSLVDRHMVAECIAAVDGKIDETDHDISMFRGDVSTQMRTLSKRSVCEDDSLPYACKGIRPLSKRIMFQGVLPFEWKGKCENVQTEINRVLVSYADTFKLLDLCTIYGANSLVRAIELCILSKYQGSVSS